VRDAARVLGFSVEQADRLATLSDRFSARATAKALRGEPLGGSQGEEGEETPTEVIARAFGQQMMPGTSATLESREVKLEARDARRGARNAQRVAHDGAEREESKLAPRGKKRLTAADRPRPNAGYEPYGSTTGHETQQQNRRWSQSLPTDARPDYMDPFAKETHNERRNPTTALTTSAADRRSPLVHAGLDPSDKRVRALAEIVDGLHQIPRHRSIHVGGFVLTAEPLSTVVPIE
jgi:error-prone DNA polymerase